MPEKVKVSGSAPPPDITQRKQLKYALREALAVNCWRVNI